MLTTEQQEIAEEHEFIPNKETALYILRPGVFWTFRDCELIVWESELSVPTQQEIDDVITQLVPLRSLFFIRQKRNEKIAETDFYLFDDYPITQENRDAIITYRQALRDLPETFTEGNIPYITKLYDAEIYMPQKPVF